MEGRMCLQMKRRGFVGPADSVVQSIFQSGHGEIAAWKCGRNLSHRSCPQPGAQLEETRDITERYKREI